jgi:hypothetical protein
LQLLEETRAEYYLCINDHQKYQAKVDAISNLFHLSGRQRLKGDNCPVFVVGKYNKTPIVMFGLNPGYSLKNNPVEDQEARRSWEHYQNLYLNFFRYFSNHRFESPYYTALGHLLAGLTGDQSRSKWELFGSYLTNLELIPYHSEGITLPSILSSSQLDYLKNRLRANVDFIIKFKPKMLLFNGNPWYVLLIKHNLVERFQKVQVSNHFNIYFFEVKGVPSVLFDKFFQRHFWGITDYDRKVTIPGIIHKRYPNLKTVL